MKMLKILLNNLDKCNLSTIELSKVTDFLKNRLKFNLASFSPLKMYSVKLQCHTGILFSSNNKLKILKIQRNNNVFLT